VCTIYEPEGRLDLARATYHAIDNRPTRVVGALWEDRFRVIEHTPEGRSNLVAGVRGTTIAQGVKAVVCAIPSKVANDMFWLYCRVTGAWI
jgi:hypothetical protein